MTKQVKSDNVIGYHELKNLQYLRLRIATITRVDPAKMRVDLRYVQEVGGRTSVRTSAAYWSPSAFMGAMPEVGSLCVIGFYHQGADTWTPVILTYLPIGLQAARRGDSQYIGLPVSGTDDIRNASTKIVHGRLQKMQPGQMLIQSTDGSDLIVSEDIALSNASANEIVLRSDDGMIVSNSIGHVLNASGGYCKWGPITRNALVIDDHILRAGSSTYDINPDIPLINTTSYTGAVAARLINPVTLTNGKKVNYICELPISVNEYGVPFTEQRTEIYELSPLAMTYTEDTDLYPEQPEMRRPLIELVRGTLVGNDPQDPDIYGRVLKAQIYNTITQSTGVFGLTEAVHSKGVYRDNELHSEAIAEYQRIGGYKKAVTKTGNMYISIPRSSQSCPLGDGHSIHADIQGAVKTTVGRENQTGTSVYIRTEGAIKSVIGSGIINDQGEKGRSIDTVTSGGINLEIEGTDNDDISYRSTMVGKKYEVVGRDNTLTTKGSYDHTVHGKSSENVLGKKSINVIDDHNTVVGGNKKSSIIGSVSDQIGSGRDVTIASPGTGVDADVLTLISGNKITTITLGNDVTTITAGDSEENITAGNKSINISVGSYDLSVGTGGITIKTSVGSVNVSTDAGSLTLSASGTVKVKGTTVNIVGGKVNLGLIPVGGVVTELHPCVISGAPHTGSKTVKCAL